MCSNKLSDKITKLNVGNERAIAMEIDLHKKIMFYKRVHANKQKGL